MTVPKPAERRQRHNKPRVVALGPAPLPVPKPPSGLCRHPGGGSVLGGIPTSSTPPWPETRADQLSGFCVMSDGRPPGGGLIPRAIPTPSTPIYPSRILHGSGEIGVNG